MKVQKKRILCRFHPYKRFIIIHKKKNSLKNEFKTTLFPHQDFCCDWMERRRNSKETTAIINALPTGHGKTFTVLMHAYKIGGFTLIICPDSLVSHHKNELTKHFNHFRNIKIISFSQFSKMNLSVDRNIFQKMYKTLIVDEIHLIKKNTKLSHNLSLLRCHFVIGLSATPDDHNFPLFANIDDKKDIFRAQKTDFTFKKINIKRICFTMTQEEKNACNAIITEQNSQLTKKNNPKSATKQCNILREWYSNTRLDSLLFYLQENQFAQRKIKIVIFSEFKSTLLALCIHIPERLRLKLDTSVKPANRDEVISKFEKEANIKFLLCTRKVAGIGIDLGFVDIMIMAEPVYDVRETVQMVGRLQRLGQTPQNLPEQHILEFMYSNSNEEDIANSKDPMDEAAILKFFKSLKTKN